MTRTDDLTRAELIQEVHRAARIERAETVQKLLRKLIRHERRQPAWPEAAEPAVSNCQ